MFWVQRLMLELSSSVLQRCCFPSQPQYGSRAPRHALPDRGPEIQAHWLPGYTGIPRTHLTTPLLGTVVHPIALHNKKFITYLLHAWHHFKCFRSMNELNTTQ